MLHVYALSYLVHCVCWGYIQDVMEYTLLAFTVSTFGMLTS